MALGFLIAAAITAALAAWVWHNANRDDDTGLVEGMLGWFGGVGMFIAFILTTVILLVAALVAWLVTMF